MSDILEDLLKGIYKEDTVIKIKLEKRRGGTRYVTVIEGIDEKAFNHKELISKFKNRLACGGTAKDGRLELQGDHRYKVRDMLIEMGFPASNILVEE